MKIITDITIRVTHEVEDIDSYKGFPKDSDSYVESLGEAIVEVLNNEGIKEDFSIEFHKANLVEKYL